MKIHICNSKKLKAASHLHLRQAARRETDGSVGITRTAANRMLSLNNQRVWRPLWESGCARPWRQRGLSRFHDRRFFDNSPWKHVLGCIPPREVRCQRAKFKNLESHFGVLEFRGRRLGDLNLTFSDLASKIGYLKLKKQNILFGQNRVYAFTNNLTTRTPVQRTLSFRIKREKGNSLILQHQILGSWMPPRPDR